MSTIKGEPTKANTLFNVTLPKYVTWAIWGIAIITLLNFFRGCGSNKEDVSNRKAVEAITVEMDSLRNVSVTKKEIELLFQIEGLKISKRMLYDNNAIIRTALRPDDRMNEYDVEIEQLQNKLNRIK